MSRKIHHGTNSSMGVVMGNLSSEIMGSSIGRVPSSCGQLDFPPTVSNCKFVKVRTNSSICSCKQSEKHKTLKALTTKVPDPFDMLKHKMRKVCLSKSQSDVCSAVLQYNHKLTVFWIHPHVHEKLIWAGKNQNYMSPLSSEQIVWFILSHLQPRLSGLMKKGITWMSKNKTTTVTINACLQSPSSTLIVVEDDPSWSCSSVCS